MALSLALIIILGLTADYVLRKTGIPGLIGMLLIGVLMGPGMFDMIDHDFLAISTDLRMIALIIILLRAGFELSKDALRKVGMRALLLSFIPAIFDMIAVTILANLLLNLSLLESAILGSIIAAVSPAVVVPLMINFINNKKGTEKGIPTLIIAATSVDDVFNIVVFSILIGFYTGVQVNIGWKLAGIPLSVLSGVGVGFISGWILYRLFKRFNPRATKRLLIILGISIILVGAEPFFENYFPFAALLAVMSMGAVILDKNEHMAHELSVRFSKLWIFAEILLFTLVGAQVDLAVALRAGFYGSIVILGALLARTVGTLLCLTGSRFSRYERLFIAISLLPKATVQAAIGGAPLIAMQTLGMDTQPGNIILAVAVLSIIITAPSGAWAILKLGNFVLEKDITSSLVSGIPTITKEKITKSIHVDEIMSRDIILVRETQALTSVFNAFAESEFTTCPVVDSNDRLQGIILLEDLRPVLTKHHEREWLIAGDIYRKIQRVPFSSSSLSEALKILTENQIVEIPVIEQNTGRVVGLLNRYKIERFLEEKLIESSKY